jgi:hypothetical protein
LFDCCEDVVAVVMILTTAQSRTLILADGPTSTSTDLLPLANIRYDVRNLRLNVPLSPQLIYSYTHVVLQKSF